MIMKACPVLVNGANIPDHAFVTASLHRTDGPGVNKLIPGEVLALLRLAWTI